MTAIIPSLITLGLCFFAYNRISNKTISDARRKDEKSDANTVETDQESDSSPSPIHGPLQSMFQQAVIKSRSLPCSTSNSPTAQGEKLVLYGLYKQACLGNRPDSSILKVPSRLHVVERAKYDAWGKCINMSKEEAMIRYIDAVQQLRQPKMSMSQAEMDALDNADIVYSDDESEISTDEETDMNENKSKVNSKDEAMSGLGLQPSTLILSSADAETSASNSKYPIHQAASEGNIQLIKSFIESSSSSSLDLINEQDEEGQTPLHLAADRGYLDVVSFLIENGANVNAIDNDGFTALFVALMAVVDKEIIKCLLDHDADPNIEDEDGESARSWVQDEGSTEMKALFGV